MGTSVTASDEVTRSTRSRGGGQRRPQRRDDVAGQLAHVLRREEVDDLPDQLELVATALLTAAIAQRSDSRAGHRPPPPPATGSKSKSTRATCRPSRRWTRCRRGIGQAGRPDQVLELPFQPALHAGRLHHADRRVATPGRPCRPRSSSRRRRKTGDVSPSRHGAVDRVAQLPLADPARPARATVRVADVARRPSTTDRSSGPISSVEDTRPDASAGPRATEARGSSTGPSANPSRPWSAAADRPVTSAASPRSNSPLRS